MSRPARAWSDHDRGRVESESWDDLPDDEDSPTEYHSTDLTDVDAPSWAMGPVEQFARPEEKEGEDFIPPRRWFRRRMFPRSFRP